MKRNLISIMLFLVFDLSYGQWHTVHPYPQSGDLNSVCFLDSLTGTAVGVNIIKTTDGGESWVFQESSVPDNMLSVSYCDLNNGMITTEMGFIQITSDGGEHWSLKNSGVNTPLYGGFCFSPEIFFALGTDGTILKSTNGGTNWAQLSSGVSLDLRSVYFVTEEKGIAVGASGTILKTSNGGSTWSAVSSGFQNNLNCVSFLDENNGYAAGEEIILKTTNGGSSWEAYLSIGMNYFSITLKDSLHGAAAGGNWVSHTFDGGQSWYSTETGPLYDLKSVGYRGSFILAVGLKGGMFCSRHSGQGWEGNTITQQELHSVFVIDNNNVIAVGNKGTIIKSTNGGNDWDILPSSPLANLNDVYFSDVNNGMVIGAKLTGGVRTFLITTNGGESWVYWDYGTNKGLNRIAFADENNGVVTGQGIVMFTSDGGVNWQQQSILNTINGVDFISPDNCYMVGGGKVYRTTNMGESWITIDFPGGGYPFTDIHFVNEQKGLVFCGGIMRTLDGGITWKNIWTGGIDAQFFSDNVGICVGGNTIWSTTNMGVDWTLVKSRLSNDAKLYKVNFLNPDLGFACGSNGVILRNTSAGLIPADEPVRKIFPDEYLLQQNYPNPFNPSTVIKYNIPSHGNVSLKVYDILGKEVITLVNNQQEPGSYEVEFNGGGLPSGVYFYRVNFNGLVESRKMILIR